MAKLELTVTATSGTLDVTPDAPVVLTVLESVGPRGPRGLISVDDTGGDGSLTYDSGSGELTYTGPSASEVRAHFSGGTGVTITDGEVAIGQAVGTSDNVTFNNVDVDGDLTVSGTTTTVNTETINLADNQITLNSNATGSATENAGIEIERGDDPNKTLIWNETDDKWTVGSETFVAGTVEANLTGDVTGTVSSLSNHDTDGLTEGATNLYYTDARSRAAISVTDAGGDGSLAYNSTTGVITFTGPSAAEVRAHLSAGGDLSYDSNTGIISFTERTDAEVRQLLSVSGDLSYNNTTGVFSFTERTDAEVRGLVSATDAGGDGSFSYNSTTGVFTYTGPSASEVRAHLSAGGDLSYDSATGVISFTERTDAEVRQLLSVSGDLSYDNTTGVFSFTERTDAEVRGLFSVAGDLSYNSTTGEFSFTERTDAEVRGLVSASGDLSYNSTTGVFSFTERTDAEVRGLVSATDAGGDGSFSYDSATGVFTYTGPSATEVRSHFTGGTGVTITNGDIAIGQAVGIGDSPQFVDLTLSGDLTVNGSTTTIDTTNLAVEDSLIELSSGLTAAAGNDAGLIIERGTTGDNAFIGWDEAADKFTLGTTTATGVSTGSLTVTTGTLVADIEGDVTGTVSSLSNHDTGDLAEGTNLYYTDARADARVNLQTGANLDLSSKTTSDLAEGTNLYYTDARADARVNLQTGANLDLSSKTTSDLAEGTNLYYTDARADARVNTANVTAAGALMDSEVTNLAQVKAFDSADYATAAQGATADTAVQPNDSPTFGNVTADGLSLGDNDAATFGGGNDLQIWHDGNNSNIVEVGTGDLNINAQNLNLADGAPNYNYYFRGIAGGEARLYHNGSQKLATKSTGVDVTGTVTADGLTVSGTSYIQSTTQPQLEIAYNSGNITGFYRSGGDFQIKNDNGAGTPETSILLGEDGAVTLYYDDAAKLATTSTGVDVTGTVTADDSITISRQSVAPALFFENSSYSGGDAAIKMFNAGQMVFETDATSQMVLDANGNVGIGTTSPQRIIHTKSSVPAIRLEDSDVSGLYHEIVGTAAGSVQFKVDAGDVQASTSLQFYVDGTERAEVNPTGVNVTGTVTADTFSFANWTVTESGGSLYFATGGTNKMKLDASGNLQVVGNVESNATIS